MNETDALRKIETITSEMLGVSKEHILPSSRFVEDLGADSLDTVELIMAFEEECGIDIPDEEAEKILTVQDAVNYIVNNAE